MFNLITRAYRRVRKMIYWLPVIWKDYDFDHYYLTRIIEHKLKSMERFEKSDRAWALRASEIGDSIRKVRMVLKRIEEDDYTTNALRYHDEKWGDIDMWFTPCPDKKGWNEMSSTRPNVCTPKDVEEERKAFMRLMKHADYMKQQDINYAMKLMAKYYQSWWD